MGADDVSSFYFYQLYRENVIKNPNTLANTEDFDISESEEVIRAVMTLSKTDRMTQVDASEVDWKLIGEELRMDPDKVRKHWEEDLYPVVATHFSGNFGTHVNCIWK